MDCVLWAAQKAKEAENEDELEGHSKENTQRRNRPLPKKMPAVDTSDEGSPEDENDVDSGPSTSPR